MAAVDAAQTLLRHSAPVTSWSTPCCGWGGTVLRVNSPDLPHFQPPDRVVCDGDRVGGFCVFFRPPTVLEVNRVVGFRVVRDRTVPNQTVLLYYTKFQQL